jgi:hypothetical protein
MEEDKNSLKICMEHRYIRPQGNLLCKKLSEMQATRTTVFDWSDGTVYGVLAPLSVSWCH